MPRNRSEKLPGHAEGWSPAGIKFLRGLGVELADAFPISSAPTISRGTWDESRTPESVRAFQRIAPEINSAYNRDRGRTYKLIAHFFEEAHGEKSE